MPADQNATRSPNWAARARPNRAHAAATLSDDFGRDVLCEVKVGMWIAVGSGDGHADDQPFQEGVSIYDFEFTPTR